jgi:hypothetical protein
VCAAIYNVILAHPVKQQTSANSSMKIFGGAKLLFYKKKLVDISHAEAAAAVATGWLAQAHAATIAPLPLK